MYYFLMRFWNKIEQSILQSFILDTIKTMKGRALYKQCCYNIFLHFRAVSIINSIFTYDIYFLNIYNMMEKNILSFDSPIFTGSL